MEHLGYEVRVLALGAFGTAIGKFGEIDETLRACLLPCCFESTLLHARNLLEFFGMRPGRAGDLKADELLPGWKAREGVTRPRLDRHRDLIEGHLIDQHLSHLTWARVDLPPSGWHYALIAHDLVAVTRAFLDDFTRQGKNSIAARELASDVEFAEHLVQEFEGMPPHEP